MPESKKRKDQTFTPPPRKGQGSKIAKPWVAPVMLTTFIVGLLWMVTFYLAGDQIPGMSALGNWNLLVGMGLIAVGFITATQWQ